jgi:hypothetical protein|tara:strand:- start:650 stop:934 length:285 start_codon:yes stop_codon:yes gene_type:complete
MGLTVNSFPIMRGVAVVDNVYINIRDLKTTKQIIDNTIHEFYFVYQVIKEERIIETKLLMKNSSEAFEANIWDLAYKYLKEELTGQNLEFTDVL